MMASGTGVAKVEEEARVLQVEEEERVIRQISCRSGTRGVSKTRRLNIAHTSKVVKYARASMTEGAKHGMRKIAQASRLTFVTSKHLKGMRVGATTHAAPTSIDNCHPICTGGNRK